MFFARAYTKWMFEYKLHKFQIYITVVARTRPARQRKISSRLFLSRNYPSNQMKWNLKWVKHSVCCEWLNVFFFYFYWISKMSSKTKQQQKKKLIRQSSAFSMQASQVLFSIWICLGIKIIDLKKNWHSEIRTHVLRRSTIVAHWCDDWRDRLI